MRIYVAATRQNDGKTVTSLGLLNVIKNYYENVGYIKPVGQQVKFIDGYKIDKDAKLMNEVFKIGCELPDMSPIAVPKGFTENYIQHGKPDDLRDQIKEAYSHASKGKDFMVIEGTGHAGVGSVFDLSNADVSQMLNSPVLIVALGGIGKPIDEVMLNKALFDKHSVKLLGVVVNKVNKNKYDKVNKFVRMGFEKKGIDVFGVVPFVPILSSPTIKQLREELNGKLLCGEERQNQIVSKILVGAMPPHAAIEYFKDTDLLITPGNREDLILAAVSGQVSGISDEYGIKGIILTGGVMPDKTVMKFVEKSNIPVLLVESHTYETAQKVNNLMVKIRPEDTEKIKEAENLIQEHVDIERILERLKELKK